MDHKYLVSALILGQAVGFAGSLVGGNEARMNKQKVEMLNASLLKVGPGVAIVRAHSALVYV